MLNTRMLPLVIAMLAGAPLVSVAQQPTRPMHMADQSATQCDMDALMMGPMMGSRMGGRTGRMMNDSSMMTQMRAELGLSDAQMEEMRSMHQRACAAAQPHIQLARQAHQAAMQALQGDKPNLDHFEDQLDKAAKHMVEAQVAMAKQMIAFRNSLTPAQRQKMDQMHQRMMQDDR